MNREDIILAVKNYTNVSTDEVTTVCQNHIDLIQDNEIASNVYNHDFSFLTDYAEINTTATYTTGTIAVTQDSTTVTGTSTVWVDTTHEGWILKVTGDDEYYEVTDINNGTQVMTLSSAYIGDTDAAATYTLYKVYYNLPTDFKKMKWAKQIVSPNRLLPISEMNMAEYFTDEFTYSGNIMAYILSGINSSNTPQVRFYPIQTDRKRVYICYVKRLPSINTTGAISKIPTQWHMLFVYKLNEIIFDMHDMPNKALKEAQKFERMLQSFIKEDKQILKDSVGVMQDQFIIHGSTFPRLNTSHYSNRY